jgi:hypothetical protein
LVTPSPMCCRDHRTARSGPVSAAGCALVPRTRRPLGLANGRGRSLGGLIERRGGELRQCSRRQPPIATLDLPSSTAPLSTPRCASGLRGTSFRAWALEGHDRRGD